MSKMNFIIPGSDNLVSHFEEVDGRKVLYVDGSPFAVLTVEIPWWDLLYDQYSETLDVYDYLYPAAKKMGLNAIKVPIKWSMVEAEKGRYDFTYLEHAKKMAEENDLKLVVGWFGHYASGDGNIYRNMTGEVFAPMYVIEDVKTYPRAIDGDGVAHHNSASYDSTAIVEVETDAFTAFMKHIREIDEATQTIVMVQVENEIAVFGADRQNRKMWRDHSQSSNRKFIEKKFTDEDDLKFSACAMTTNWLQPMTDAGKKEYPLPFFVNFVGGQLEDWMVGGSPGEDVNTYLVNCPALDFCGLNLYTQPGRSVNDLRAALTAYKVGRNLPSITETNSDMSGIAPRLACLSVGEFGSPIFAPWALNASYPTPYQPYVLEDGSIANGGPGLRECYETINKAMAPIAYYAGTNKLKVFMGVDPGEKFSITTDLNGAKLMVSGQANGQVIIIHPNEREFLIAGYRCQISIATDKAIWPNLKDIKVEKGKWEGNQWFTEGEVHYTINQSESTIGISLNTSQVQRIEIG